MESIGQPATQGEESVRTPRVHLRLYVAGGAPNSAMAVANLRVLTEERLPGLCVVETVDLLADPQRALTDEVFVTPLLLRVSPLPPRRVVGTLRDMDSVMSALDLGSPAS